MQSIMVSAELYMYCLTRPSLIKMQKSSAKVLDQDNGSTNVLEHHSNMDPKKETIESELLADNWDSPIVVTTSVQFFESFYSRSQAGADAYMRSGRQSLSLMRHRLSRSVI